MKRRLKSVAVKADISDAGKITGYASTFTREPDAVGDVVARGAFSKFLARMRDEGGVLPLLYNHDQSLGSFIGTVTDIREDERGLLFTAEFDATEKAQRARELAMDGRLSKFSFAYVVREQAEVTLADGRRANELRELDVDEVSLVLMPCNPDASVVDVKAGRRNSKSDEDTIRQAIELLQSLLGDEQDDIGGQGGDGSEGGADEDTPKGREETVAVPLEEYKALLKAQFGGNHEQS